MRLAPQEIRTFFITAGTHQRQRVFAVTANAELMLSVLQDQRDKIRFALHAFVIMPDHVHLLLTPAPEHSLEKCVQLVKGGFSFRMARDLGKKFEIWQPRYTEHRVKDKEDYWSHVEYIHENPVRAGLVSIASEYPFSSAKLTKAVDPGPEWFSRAKALSK